MKNLFRDWRGLAGVIALAAITLHAAPVPQVQTLGGGPNQLSPARSGAADGDTFTTAKFNNPSAIAEDTSGDLFIADRMNNKVRKVTGPGTPGSVTTTFASRLPGAIGVAVDGFNRVHVVTIGDGRLRVFNSDGTLARTVSGLSRPTAVTLDGSGNVFVTEMGGSVKQIAPDNTITTIATGFRKPQGIALMRDGLLAVSDTGNHAVRSVDPGDGTTVLIAGNNGAGFTDGPGAGARFKKPMGLAVAADGGLVVADRGNHRVRVIGTDNVVSTLYGVKPSRWTQPFPGWVDGAGGGDTGVAAAHDPVGVAVARTGTIYVSETFWDILRQVTSGTNTPGPGPGPGTNGINTMSFGFASGEGSSDFIGAAGQTFYAPITLSLTANQAIYSMQFSVTGTNEGATAFDLGSAGFVSMLLAPASQVITTNPFTGEIRTNEVDYVGFSPNYVFLNSSINMLGIGYIERYPKTNLYNTRLHHLVQYSGVKDHVFNSSGGQVIVGGYKFLIPPTSTGSDTFRVTLSRASASAQDWTVDVPIRLPSNGSLGPGALNAIKRVTLASRPYVVGDALPFRWLNAGEFGNGFLVNNDVIQVFETAVYGLNFPLVNTGTLGDSDLFDAMDSSDGTSATVNFGDDLSINSITNGNGGLQVDDVWVTFRRAQDPTLKWFARYWSNGVRQVVEVPNRAIPGGEPVLDAPKAHLAGVSVQGKLLERPRVDLTVSDVMAVPGAALQIPLLAELSGAPIRVMMVNLYVEALDGSPAVSEAIQFKPPLAFPPTPSLTSSRGAGNYAAAWLDEKIQGYSSPSGTFGFVNVKVPDNAGSQAAYRVHFTHFSASPNGGALLETHVTSGLILLGDRSGSTWNDGISDAWRLRYFGSIYASASDPAADADADGVLNGTEYVNGTDPTDATSY